MRTFSRASLFLLLTALASGAPADQAPPVEPTGQVQAGAAGAAPVTPARPHGRSYDPHGGLDPDTLLQIALRHKAEGRPQEALHTLSLAIDGNPRHARLYSVRGSVLLEQGRISPALADLGKALSLDPEDPETLTNRAQAYRQFGRVEAALADLDRAIAIDADLLAARFNRGAMRYGTGDYPGALEDFDHCIALDPHLPGPYFNRAAVQDALGREAAAIADLERFLQISKNEAWNAQAQALLAALRNPPTAPTAPAVNPHR